MKCDESKSKRCVRINVCGIGDDARKRNFVRENWVLIIDNYMFKSFVLL